MEPKIQEKTWSKDFETQLATQWREKPFGFDASKKKIFSIDTPPPYVNTPIHIGQATTYVLMDMFARFHRMIGDEVLFPLGLDRNGLPIEMAAEKRFGVKLMQTKRDDFIGLCKKILEETSFQTIDSYIKLGISFSSWSTGDNMGSVYMTDSPQFRALTQWTFVDLWSKGLVYEDERVNNWCPGCQTTIADAEVIYEDRPGFFYHVIFKTEDGKELVIATTRPELICTCEMIIYNPEDERYKNLSGYAYTPLFNKRVRIKAHTDADKDKGTGLMMMCSFGDLTDIRFFREQGIKPTIAINKDGTMNENAGFLKDLSVSDARKEVVLRLENAGLVVKKESTQNHRTPICERSKDPIEFIFMKEFYIKQIDRKNEMKKIADKTHFFADESRQILHNWIDSISIDWPVSRRRYYATEIPLWYCAKCNAVVLPKKYGYVQPWKEKAPIDRCKCGSTDFRGEERVFDTWFDSSTTPLYILGKRKSFKGYKSCTLRPQGKEIVRTWLYYTLFKAHCLTGKKAFKDVWINHHVVDESGKKMSKSLGNIIDPHEIIEKYGAEPFRLWCAVEGDLSKTDFRCSFDRIEGAGKTLTKLWNVCRFISMFPRPAAAPRELQELDKWILGETAFLVDLARKKYQKYNFHTPVVMTKTFIWDTFASHYLELAKPRAYNNNALFNNDEQASAHYTMYTALDNVLRILAPVIPFETYLLYKQMFGVDVHRRTFPEKMTGFKTKLRTDEIVSLNSSIWKIKKDKKLSLKAEVREAMLPASFASMEKDIRATHNIKNIIYGEKTDFKLHEINV